MNKIKKRLLQAAIDNAPDLWDVIDKQTSNHIVIIPRQQLSWKRFSIICASFSCVIIACAFFIGFFNHQLGMKTMDGSPLYFSGKYSCGDCKSTSAGTVSACVSYNEDSHKSSSSSSKAQSSSKNTSSSKTYSYNGNTSRVSISSSEAFQSCPLPKKYRIYSIDSLIKRVENPFENDPYQEILSFLKKLGKLTIPLSINNTFNLIEIWPHTLTNSMTFEFKDDENTRLTVVVCLFEAKEKSLTLKERIQKTYPNLDITAFHNNSFKLNEKKIDYLYHDGYEYEIIEYNKEKYINFTPSSSYFTLNNTLFRVNGSLERNQKKWDSKYLSYFDFKEISLKK
jgi:hypothetical protein